VRPGLTGFRPTVKSRFLTLAFSDHSELEKNGLNDKLSRHPANDKHHRTSSETSFVDYWDRRSMYYSNRRDSTEYRLSGW
jgi:hypothetical protein